MSNNNLVKGFITSSLIHLPHFEQLSLEFLGEFFSLVPQVGVDGLLGEPRGLRALLDDANRQQELALQGSSARASGGEQGVVGALKWGGSRNDLGHVADNETQPSSVRALEAGADNAGVNSVGSDA